MSWWFGRPKKTAEIHALLSKEELSAVAAALLELAEHAYFSAAPLVISPGSIKSIRFLGQLDRLCGELEANQTDPAALRRIQAEIQKLQAEFGEWQRQQTEEILDDFSSSLQALVNSAQETLDSQDAALGHLNSMQTRLSAARECQDIVQIREVLRKEVTSAREFIQRQTSASESIRQEFTGAVREMQSRLAKAEEASQTDHLTRLGNRAAFEFFAEAVLQKVKHGERAYSIGVMDLDGFKAVNDTYGHAKGDEVLNAFAGRLRRQFPKPMFVGRFGGDEFVVVAQISAAQLDKRLCDLDSDLARHPVQIEGADGPISVRIGVSAGVVEMTPSSVLPALVKTADERMYEQKRQRKAQAA